MQNISWRHFDFWLLGAVTLLTLFGIIMIRSAIAGNIELIEGNTVQKQIIFAVTGFAVIGIMAAIDYKILSALSRPLYVGTIIVLAILVFFGGALFGSARWFVLGPILIQPSELAKIVIILVLADFLARHQAKIHDLRWVARSLILTLGLVIWILLQPDLSTSIVIFVIWFTLVWAAGLEVKHVLIAGGVGALLVGISLPLMLITYNPEREGGIIKAYQVERIINFLFPDPAARYGAIYNVQQALVSIGSGGWLGKGYESGTQVQLRFLKVRHSDFIFSALAEEFGFVGTMVVMALLIFIILRCLRAARLASDTFGALIAYGVATILAFQAVVNIGMNLQLLPVTGLPLPFVSYGGSSLLSMLLGIGLVESVILRHKALDF
ncbi:MAG: rod shape-determining protein RodA [Anaerolineales bacterium]|nr:rod shape-determining protein RodA [Chloroflexota bacterium]MBL7163154.1 rod shape-determining protein RodA [Anaerolineales bacterium]